MANNMKSGYNFGIVIDDIEFADTPITSTNTNKVTSADDSGAPISYVPGTLINSLTTLTKDQGLMINMKSAADFTAFFSKVLGRVEPAIPEPMTWIQLFGGAANGTGGDISKPSDEVGDPADNAGGTANKKLAKVNGNYAEFTIDDDPINSSGVIFGLSGNNNGSYNVATDSLLAAAFIYKPDTPTAAILKYYTGNVSAEATVAATTPAAGGVIRFEVSGNDVLLKYNGTLKFTFVGALTGVNNIWIKTLFAGTAPIERILKATSGLGLY